MGKGAEIIENFGFLRGGERASETIFKKVSLVTFLSPPRSHIPFVIKPHLEYIGPLLPREQEGVPGGHVGDAVEDCIAPAVRGLTQLAVGEDVGLFEDEEFFQIPRLQNLTCAQIY